MPILELCEVAKRFGQTIALEDVNLSVDKGTVHALIGENGAGKSTLMNIISGALSPDHGTMKLRGANYSTIEARHARKNGIALIHQELSLAPDLTVTENILMGQEISRFGWLDGKSNESLAVETLKNFDHPEIGPGMQVGKLSTAAQQVVEICRALAGDAEIILMDEPTSSLQRDDVRRLFDVIRRLKSNGISIIYISHFLEEVREIADKFTVLRDGRSVAAGKLADVADDYLISQMVGRPTLQIFPKRQPSNRNAENLLSVNRLSAPPFLKSASFEIRQGEILGIAGLIGAGRSEMIRALFGIEKPSGGDVVIRGKAITARGGDPSFWIREGLGYLGEDRKAEGLALDLSVADNITMTRFGSCSKLGWLNLGAQSKQSEKLIRDLDVRASKVSQPVSSLSGGNQQKIAIARLLHQRADIYLLDEPTRGIDIGSKAKIYKTIASLADQGKAVLLVSSYLPELFGMCDRLAVMTSGILSPARPIGDWTPELVLQTAIGSVNDGYEAHNNGH
jgi:ribose transport system ATP-binding protein